MRDIVEMLYNRQVCSLALNSCRNSQLCEQAAEEITRLRAERDALVSSLRTVQMFLREAEGSPETAERWAERDEDFITHLLKREVCSPAPSE